MGFSVVFGLLRCFESFVNPGRVFGIGFQRWLFLTMFGPSWYFTGCCYVERGSVRAWGFMAVRGSMRDGPFDNDRVRV